jgi:MSHA pilin protein MshA
VTRNVEQCGASVVELVVVIAVLAVLAAFALPRFSKLEVEGRAADVQALAGSVRSGAALAHALWLASGRPGAVEIDDSSIDIVDGYPSLATIDDTVADLDGFTYDPATGVFQMAGVATACNVTYLPPKDADSAPTVFVASPLVC